MILQIFKGRKKEREKERKKEKERGTKERNDIPILKERKKKERKKEMILQI